MLSPRFALFRFVLLETDGAPEVLAALQVFMSCLTEALEKENKQVHHTVSAAQSLQSAGGCCGHWCLLVLGTTHSLTRARSML